MYGCVCKQAGRQASHTTTDSIYRSIAGVSAPAATGWLRSIECGSSNYIQLTRRHHHITGERQQEQAAQTTIAPCHSKPSNGNGTAAEREEGRRCGRRCRRQRRSRHGVRIIPSCLSAALSAYLFLLGWGIVIGASVCLFALVGRGRGGHPIKRSTDVPVLANLHNRHALSSHTTQPTPIHTTTTTALTDRPPKQPISAGDASARRLLLPVYQSQSASQSVAC